MRSPVPARVLLAASAIMSVACAPRLRMCTVAVDCGSLSSCVAGRCVARSAVPAIAAARRMLYDPVAVGYVRRGSGGKGEPGERGGEREEGEPATPAVASLGRADGALAFLRFSVPLAPEVGVVEAYVLLHRVSAVDADPAPVLLHTAPVIDPWDARSLSWALQPRVEEIGSPVTSVRAAAGAAVRLDAGALVERWRRRRRSDADLGMAIVAQGESPTGIAFALVPLSPGDAPEAQQAGEPAAGPKLELYVQ